MARNEEPTLFEPDKISEDNQHRPHFGNSEEYSLAAEEAEWPQGQVKALGKPIAETFTFAETPKTDDPPTSFASRNIFICRPV